jgi:hypothetical protein
VSGLEECLELEGREATEGVSAASAVVGPFDPDHDRGPEFVRGSAGGGG